VDLFGCGKMLYQRTTPSFSEVDFESISKWSSEDRQSIILTIWVDCVNIQAGISSLANPKKTMYFSPVSVSNSSDAYGVLQTLRTKIAFNKCNVCYSVISFAGPVLSDHVVITNWNCESKEKVIHFTQIPYELAPIDRRNFINDLEASSYGIIARYFSESIDSIFDLLWKTPKTSGKCSISGSSLVLWIGSGFGCSFICRDDFTDSNSVVSSEAGHSQAFMCDPGSSDFVFEKDFFSYVSQRFYSKSHQPEWEDLCSFRGLEEIYSYFCMINHATQSRKYLYQEILSMALKHDEIALKSFFWFYKFIIRASQSFCFAVRCQRVFIISDFQVQSYEILMSFKDRLQKEFYSHPRSEWLENTEVFVQKQKSMFPLSGGIFLSRIHALGLKNNSRN